MASHGVFITLEGADGSGKTTQVRLLADWLKERGHIVRCTREPGGTPLGDKIRSLVLDPAYDNMAAETEALLYMAARAQHVAEVIRPALACGETVLSDRYADSTIVYQGAARHLAAGRLGELNDFASGGLKPDLTIVLDGQAVALRRRVACRGAKDRLELEADEFHERVRQGFLQLARTEPERIRVVEALGTVGEVQRRIQTVVTQFLNRGGRIAHL